MGPYSHDQLNINDADMEKLMPHVTSLQKFEIQAYQTTYPNLPGNADIHSLSRFLTSSNLTAPQRFTG